MGLLSPITFVGWLSQLELSTKIEVNGQGAPYFCFSLSLKRNDPALLLCAFTRIEQADAYKSKAYREESPIFVELSIWLGLVH